ncbi:MAG: DUF4349 domain-containing protein [Actinomycetota bacterium]|nr:DUF4349 domain-containing protein [Actinomycetota bacterium]
MSTQTPASGTPSPETPRAGGEASLPVLSAQRIDEIEDALFADIARERTRQSTRSTRRGRLWIAGGAAAAVIAVAAIIAPSVGSLVSTTEESAVAPVAPVDSAGGAALDTGKTTAESLEGQSAPVAPDAAGSDASSTVATDRDIITTASATVTVEDVDAAARAVGEAAVEHGGYVESLSVGSNGSVYPIPPMEGGVVDSTMPYPAPTEGAWVTVRVPADQLSAVVDELAGLGEVTATNISRQDVTEQAVDLRARIDAAQASVDRLTELMTQAQNVGDLIAAESALAERQATLESYQQQLEMLDDQVAMSTLSVTVLPRVVPVTADPAGFGDGLAAGWNGLVATLNGIVVAIGFLIPWLVVAAVAALIVWGVVRLVRTRRRRRDASAQSAPPREEP